MDDGTLHAYLDGELSPPEAQGIEAHLAQCPGCRTRLEEERALIARAAELLGRAAPPDREMQPFRHGDGTPPARLWWRVRLPLAWAATVVLALGIGIYLGPTAGRVERPAVRGESQHAAQPATPPARELPQPKPRVQGRVATRTPPAAPPPAPSVPAVASSLAIALPEKRRVAFEAAEPTGYPSQRSPIGLDSARLVLGGDPLAVPGAPVRGIYTAREIGYSALVIVEQVLDSGTTIDVINGRRAALALSDMVVTASGAARSDTVRAGTPARLGRSADSLAAVPRKRAAAPAVAPAADESAAGLWLEVRGPLSADSLAALRRRLRPLRP